jgi:hypothetical protein
VEKEYNAPQASLENVFVFHADVGALVAFVCLVL